MSEHTAPIPEKISFTTRLSLSLELAFLMFLCGAMVAFFKTYQIPHAELLAYAVALGVPAVAWLGFVILACLIPSLVAPGKLVFPLNITLPLVFAALTFLVHGLVMRSGSSLTAPPDRLLPATIWGQSMPLLTALAAQILTLSAFMAIGKAARRAP